MMRCSKSFSKQAVLAHCGMQTWTIVNSMCQNLFFHPRPLTQVYQMPTPARETHARTQGPRFHPKLASSTTNASQQLHALPQT
eukprot:67378-Amphidinium_carterae.1